MRHGRLQVVGEDPAGRRLLAALGGGAALDHAA